MVTDVEIYCNKSFDSEKFIKGRGSTQDLSWCDVA